MIVTNALGVVFTATLLSASQTGVKFVFPEDGATNELTWTQLSPASYESVCDASGFTPIPPALVATFTMAERERRRLDALAADKRLEPVELARRRKALRARLELKCKDQGLSPRRIDALLKQY